MTTDWLKSGALLLVALLGWAYGLGHKLAGLDGGKMWTRIKTLQIRLEALQDAAERAEAQNQREFDRLQTELGQIREILEKRR